MQTSETYHQYEQIRESLHFLAHSPRNQVNLVNQWITERIKGNNLFQIKSYLGELCSRIIFHAPNLPTDGCAPAFFEDVARNLSYIHNSVPSLFTDEEITRTVQHLNRHALTIHCYLGAPDAYEQGEQSFRDELPPECAEHETLARYIDFLKKRGAPDVDLYEKIAADWDKRTKGSDRCILIPLIEQDITGGEIAGFRPFGMISELCSAIQPLPAGDGKDVIQLDNMHSSSGIDTNGGTIELIPEAVRHVGCSILRNYTPAHYTLSVHFPETLRMYTGLSFSLGLTVNSLAQLSREATDRHYFRVSGSTVFTGAVDKTGQVQPMRDRLVRKKIETVFYSPHSTLVIPKANEACGEKHLDELREKHPQRRLELLPVRQVADIFNSRLVIHSVQRNWKERAAMVYRRYQAAITLVSVALMLVFTAYLYFFVLDFDENPALILRKDNQFIVQNQRGRTLWKKFISAEEMPFDERDQEDRQKQLSWVVDLEKDGNNEVLLGHPNRPIAGTTEYFYCYEYDGALRWKVKIGFPTRTNEGNYINMVFMLMTSLVTTDSAGMPHIYTSAGGDFYPCYIQEISTTGKVLQTYGHCGNLKDLHAFNEYVIAAGTNNSYFRACAAVFDPADMNGRSPQQEPRVFLEPEIEPGREAFYILFPRTDMQEYIDNIDHSFARVNSTTDTTIEFALNEFGFINADSTLEMVDIFYTFDAAFRPIGVRTSSRFDRTHLKLYQEGKLDRRISADWKKDLLNRVQYWDGEKFVREWTKNRMYEEGRRNPLLPASNP